MDLEKVHELHRKVMSDIIKSPIFTEEQKQNFYEFYVELNKHDPSEWAEVGKRLKNKSVKTEKK